MRLSFGGLRVASRPSGLTLYRCNVRLRRTMATDAAAVDAAPADAKPKVRVWPPQPLKPFASAEDLAKPYSHAEPAVTPAQWSELKAQNEKLYDQVDMNILPLKQSEFFPDVWLANTAVQAPLKRALRTLIAKHTKQVLLTPKYHTTRSADGSGGLVQVTLREDVLYTAKKSAARIESTHAMRLKPANEPAVDDVRVLNADLIDTGADLKRAGFNPLVMVAGGAAIPGGSWLRGTSASGVEEEVYRRTSLCYNVQTRWLPLPVAGCAYVPNGIVFRGGLSSGYRLLAEPYTLAFAHFEQIRAPTLIQADDSTWMLAPPYINQLKLKFRSLLRLAKHNKHDAVVIPPFGGGSYKNPARHIASIWKHIFAESEFAGQLPAIRFAIADDFAIRPNWQPDGALRPYLEVFAADPKRVTGYVPPAAYKPFN